ncbi:alkene reductase [Corynebacterium otitidis]
MESFRGLARSPGMAHKLFSPITFGAHEAPNRVTVAGLTRQRAGEDGLPTELHERYYSQRASFGLVVTEGSFVDFSSRSFPGQTGIANDEQQAAWQRVADAVHDNGGLLSIQIMHGGRVSAPEIQRGAPTVAPSPHSDGVKFHDWDGSSKEAPTPKELNVDEIAEIVETFRRGARRAVDAGIDFVEVHGANGYLLHQFLAPSANHRTDDYGGTPEKRARLVLEVVDAVADEIGDERTGVRLAPQFPVQALDESDDSDAAATYRAVGEGLSRRDLAYVSLSSPSLRAAGVAAVRDAVRERGIPVLANASAATEPTSLEDAESFLDEGLGDAVAVGRLTISNPDLPIRWERGLELTEPDQATFYGGGAHGYTDYPFHDDPEPYRP